MGKRGAAPAGPAWKKQRGATVRSKINTVIAALRDTNLESEATEISRKMLAEGAVAALSQMVEDRHPMQTRVGDFIKETLEDIAARLQGKVDDAKKSVSTMESELEVQKAQLQAATDELAEAKEKVTKKAEQTTAAKKALGECEQADAMIARDQAGTNRRQGQLTKEQSKFTDIRDNLLQVLIDDGINANGSAKESKKACDKLLKQITNLGAESALLAAAPAVLLKKPEEREGFDSHVLDCLKATLADKLGEIQKGLDEISAEVEAKLPEKTAKAEETAKAKAAFDEAQKELDAAEEVACDKEVGLVKAKTQLEATEQALQAKAKVIEAATGEVDAFSEVLAIFTEVAERSHPPEVPEDAKDAEAEGTSTAPAEGAATEPPKA